MNTKTILFLLFVWALAAPYSHAMIRVLESGKTFKSWPDLEVGPRLAEGERFTARLQMIEGNSHLCLPPPKGTTWNVTVPSDGLPVALFVKGGICSKYQQVQNAESYIQPEGIVKFLIIGDLGKATSFEKNAIANLKDTGREDVGSIIDSSSTSSISSSFPEDIFEPLQISRQTLKQPIFEVQSSVLHVSYATSHKLQQLLILEFPSVKMAGGVLLELNGNSPSKRWEKVGGIWMMFIILVCMSGCLCLLSLVNNIMEATEPAQQLGSRPRRRRLAPWQVRNNFPVGVFDGNALKFSGSKVPSEFCQPNHNIALSNAGVNPTLDTNTDNLAQMSVALTDEACTICLDEFSVGDKLRCLPCEHAFHSKCISKWMTERVATCPLCKIDYYESDEESVEDEETPGVTPLSSSWGSVPPEATTALATEDSAVSQEIRPSENTTDRWRRRGRALGRWGRSLFGNTTVGEGQSGLENPQSSLVEPLLSSGTDALEHASTGPSFEGNRPNETEETSVEINSRTEDETGDSTETV